MNKSINLWATSLNIGQETVNVYYQNSHSTGAIDQPTIQFCNSIGIAQNWRRKKKIPLVVFEVTTLNNFT